MRGRHAPPALLVLSLLLALCPQTASAGGAGANALGMSITVNTVPAGAGVVVRTGGYVVKRYRLVNRGEADLYAVGVDDPGVPGGRASCPRRTLGALRSMVCTARFRARPGRHAGTARATGDIPSLGERARATARSGYEGVAGALALAEAVRVGQSGSVGTATVRYTVANRGNRPVHALRLTDPAFGAGPGGLVCTLPELAPGASAGCAATVRRGPGAYRSAGLAEGTDRITTLGEHGERLPPPPLTAHASATFRVAAPPAPPAPRTSPAPPRAGPPASRPARTPPVRTTPPATAGAIAEAVAAAAAEGAAAAEAAAEATEAAEATDALAGAALGAVAGGALPPAAAGTGNPASPAPTAQAPAEQAPATRLPAVRPPPARVTVADDEGLLPRLQRRSRELPRLGVVLTLLLILIPAAIAAVLLGNRHT
ncbi:hypothetical protein [Streptomyces sp. NPDC051909]|uniref:hypothetical protein n=1 Tax=Streptomyces sp. NPDC051909 TaxID=3154944 RepID=UPI003442253A